MQKIRFETCDTDRRERITERRRLSPLAKRRREIVDIIEIVLVGVIGVGIYVLIGLALRAAGVA